MTLHEKLIFLHPELKDLDFAAGVITLQNNSDGQGEYIAEWNHPTFAKPTDEQLKGA